MPKNSASANKVGIEEAILAVSSSQESSKVVKGRKGKGFVNSTATVNQVKGKTTRGSSGVASVAAVATVTSVTEAVEQEKVIIIYD